MELFRTIATRYSHRGAFRDTPVPREDLEKIARAGLNAPTACNAQSCSLVIVTEPELLRGIARLFADYPVVNTARAMIVIVADERPVYQDISFFKEDCAAAAENMLLAITALGYASVWLDGVLRMEETARTIGNILSVPDNRRVQILLPVGVPEARGTSVEKKPFGDRAFFNHWGCQH